MYNQTKNAKAVTRICDFGSVAMLDYLERSGVFIPQNKRKKNRGRKREYTFRDVLVLKTISTLLQNGATVSNLKGALSSLQRIPWKAEPAVLEDSQGALRHLIVSGGKVYFTRNNEELIDLTSGGQLSFFFILDIDKIYADVAKDWDQAVMSFSI